MDVHLPGTPVAIDIDDLLEEIDDVPSSRPVTSSSRSSHGSKKVPSVSGSIADIMNDIHRPPSHHSTHSSGLSNNTSRPPTSGSNSSVQAEVYTNGLKSPTSDYQRSTASPMPAVSTPRPPTSSSRRRGSISPRSTPSPRPPVASRPGTSESRKSTSGSSTGSFGSRLSMPNYSSLTENDTQWRNKLHQTCFLPHLNDNFKCPACTLVLYYPVQLSNCDHRVCSSCLTIIMKGTTCCPVDKKKIDRSQVVIPRDFVRELNGLRLHCPQSDLGCQWIGTYGDFKDHNMTCKHADALCPNGCGHKGEKRNMDDHVLKECSLRLVTCEFCMRAVRAEKEIDHLKQCPRFPISCSNTCGKKNIPREELEKHIEEECPLGEIKCPFKRMGCYVTGSREFITRHISDDLTTHLETLCRGLNEYLDRLDDHEQRIDKYSNIIQENKLQVANLIRMQGCQMLWKIDNWGQRGIEATTGKKAVLRSPPFFTGKYGYKLALTLMPNGDGKAKGKFLSLYVCVCKGEYDALASWPFSMTLTFTLLDQCQDPRARVNHTYVMRPNPCKENLPFLGRPESNFNSSFGAQGFAPLDLLETRDYVRDDAIFIKILAESDV